MIEQDQTVRIASLVGRLKAFEQRKYFSAVITYIAKQLFSSEIISKDDTSVRPSPSISGAACLLNTFIHNNETLKDHVASSLPKSTIPSLIESLATLRAVVAALAQDEG